MLLPPPEAAEDRRDRATVAFAVIMVLGGLALALFFGSPAPATVDVPAASGIASLNALTGPTQTFAVGTTGTDVAFSSSATTHTLNVPSASASNRGAVTTGTQTFAGAKTFSTSVDATALSIGTAPQSGAVFYRTCTITSAAAATPVNCLADADVPASMAAFVTHWHAKVNGATLWAVTTSCVIEDTSGNDFATMAVTALTGNAFIVAGTLNTTAATRFALGTGGAVDKGIQISCDQNGTGSDLVVTIAGVIK